MLIQTLLLLAITGEARAQSTVSAEKAKLLSEAKKITIQATITTDDLFERELQKLRDDKDGNPSSADIENMMRQFHLARQKKDEKLRTKTPPPEYDLTLTAQSSPVVDYEALCKGDSTNDITSPEGDKIRMLSYALVFNEGGRNFSTRFGHVMQRFDYCRNNKYVGLIFTEGPLDSGKLAQEAASQYGFSPAQVQNIKPISPKPSLFGWLIEDISQNYRQRVLNDQRSIYEAHLDVSPSQMYRALMFNVQNFSSQADALLSNSPLPGYSALHRSCLRAFVLTINNLIPQYADSGIQILPKNLMSYVLDRHTKRLIVYPDQNMISELGLVK